MTVGLLAKRQVNKVRFRTPTEVQLTPLRGMKGRARQGIF